MEPWIVLVAVAVSLGTAVGDHSCGDHSAIDVRSNHTCEIVVYDPPNDDNIILCLPGNGTEAWCNGECEWEVLMVSTGGTYGLCVHGPEWCPGGGQWTGEPGGEYGYCDGGGGGPIILILLIVLAVLSICFGIIYKYKHHLAPIATVVPEQRRSAFGVVPGAPPPGTRKGIPLTSIPTMNIDAVRQELEKDDLDESIMRALHSRLAKLEEC